MLHKNMHMEVETVNNDIDIHQTFAKRLKGLREAAGLTQKELADLLHYSRGSISYYENCDRVPDIDFLMAASEFFDVGPHFLLGYSNNQTMSNEDIGIRFGLSDRAIEILDGMGLCEYREFISAFVEHKLFPGLFECMTLYNKPAPLENKTLEFAYWEEIEFRHFQLTRIIMTILDDLQKDFILCGKGTTALNDVDEEKRIQFYKDMLLQSEVDTDRLIAEYRAEDERLDSELRKRYQDWEDQNQQNRKARIAAQGYAACVDSLKGESENGHH